MIFHQYVTFLYGVLTHISTNRIGAASWKRCGTPEDGAARTGCANGVREGHGNVIERSD
jgi:hypothetical protein